MSPRCTSARSYSPQLLRWYFVSYLGWTLEFMLRRWPIGEKGRRDQGDWSNFSTIRAPTPPHARRGTVAQIVVDESVVFEPVVRITHCSLHVVAVSCDELMGGGAERGDTLPDNSDRAARTTVADVRRKSSAIAIPTTQSGQAAPVLWTTCGFSLFVRRSRSDCDAKKGGCLHHRGLGADLVCLDFPVHRNKFPVPDHREFDATTAETLGNLRPSSLRGV